MSSNMFVLFVVYSGHFFSASSSPLLLRGAPNYSTDTVSEFHAEAHMCIYGGGIVLVRGGVVRGGVVRGGDVRGGVVRGGFVRGEVVWGGGGWGQYCVSA